MSGPLSPLEVFRRAADEGRRRLDQSTLELLSTGFIAGFTIVFGLIGLAIVDALARELVGDLARVPAALVFAFGVVFLIVGRAELFTENFFDPIASAVESGGWRTTPKLLRLWGLTLALNLVGGFLLVFVMTAPGALPHGAAESFTRIAEEIATRPPLGTLARAIVGGALVSLLSFLVASTDYPVGRIAVAYLVGVLLALGPFDHVVVSGLQLGFGWALGADLAAPAVAEALALGIVGNLLGGIGLVTLSHAAQAKGAEKGS